MYYLDPGYIIVMLLTTLIMGAANWWVSSTYKRWGQTRNSVGMNGQDAAQRLLAHARLSGVEVAAAQGRLGDHYDPRTRRLHLSPEVAGVPSVASLAITAHEIGHAMQDRDGYVPLRIRSALVPAASVGSTLGWILIFIGLILGFFELALVGLVVFAIGAVFALATLPVEFNASSRARQLLTDSGLLYTEDERRGVSSMLNAAAFTYVAALIVAILNVLRFAFMIGGFGRRRD